MEIFQANLVTDALNKSFNLVSHFQLQIYRICKLTGVLWQLKMNLLTILIADNFKIAALLGLQ